MADGDAANTADLTNPPGFERDALPAVLKKDYGGTVLNNWNENELEDRLATYCKCSERRECT